MSSQSRQGGFTLIELIVVIVLLGILAAVAMPKFVNLGRDARIATVMAAKGAMASTAAFAHGKYLVTTPVPTTVTFEGVIITFSTAVASGYPKADASFVAASGLSAADYTITAAGTSVTISPASAPTAATCSVVYTEPAAVNTAPTFTVTTTGC